MFSAVPLFFDALKKRPLCRCRSTPYPCIGRIPSAPTRLAFSGQLREEYTPRSFCLAPSDSSLQRIKWSFVPIYALKTIEVVYRYFSCLSSTFTKKVSSNFKKNSFLRLLASSKSIGENLDNSPVLCYTEQRFSPHFIERMHAGAQAHMNNRRPQLYRLAFSAVFLSLALLLPFLTGQNRELGNMLCLMHLPVFLCAFLCGPWHGALVGACAPLLRSLMLGMPPLFPTALCMAGELAAYGLLAGLLRKIFPKKVWALYLSQILSMIGGRLVWGLLRFLLAGLDGSSFPLSAFLSGALLTALPGIALQLLFIVPAVLLLEKTKLFSYPAKNN